MSKPGTAPPGGALCISMLSQLGTWPMQGQNLEGVDGVRTPRTLPSLPSEDLALIWRAPILWRLQGDLRTSQKSLTHSFGGGLHRSHRSGSSPFQMHAKLVPAQKRGCARSSGGGDEECSGESGVAQTPETARPARAAPRPASAGKPRKCEGSGLGL